MKTIILALMLIPSISLAQGYEIIEPLPRLPSLNQPSQPVYIAPSYVAPSNRQDFNKLLQAETRNKNIESMQRREQVIDQRLGIYGNNPDARNLMRTMIESELNAR
jgi:hypothetical protein